MQNPSDPVATYDGHKGPGYQTQIAETCHLENEVQLIYLKIAGWNILRASVCAKMHEIIWKRANMAACWLNFAFLRWVKTLGSVPMSLKRQIRLYLQQLHSIPNLSKTA